MNQFVFASLIACVCLVSCTKPKARFLEHLSPSNLPTQNFTIDPMRDTVLNTSNGAIISIPANSIRSDNRRVELDVKEAYTAAEMVAAGLVTKSGDKLLSSGGMIRIGTLGNATLEKSIAVSIPAKRVNRDMLLFTGKASDDRTIDWTEPRGLDPPEEEMASRGEKIYKQYCTSCHRLSGDLVGPALGHITDRREMRWLINFTWNPSNMVNGTDTSSFDRYARCIWEHYRKSEMPSFTTLSDSDLVGLYTYIREASKNIDPATVPDYKLCFDSCVAYETSLNSLQSKRSKLISDNGARIQKEFVNTTRPNNTVDIAGPNDKVSPHVNPSEYYTFQITAFGWYNIDILLEEIAQNSRLIARLPNVDVSDINVFLVIPSDKVFTDGGLIKGSKDEYGFYKNDGTLPLPQGRTAYVLAFGETDGQLLFAKTKFVTKSDQTFDLLPANVMKEQFNAEIKTLDVADLDIIAEDSKNATALGSVDTDLKNLQALKPVNCDCNCGKGDEGDVRALVQ